MNRKEIAKAILTLILNARLVVRREGLDGRKARHLKARAQVAVAVRIHVGDDHRRLVGENLRQLLVGRRQALREVAAEM